jgi:flavin reductase (NADH)
MTRGQTTPAPPVEPTAVAGQINGSVFRSIMAAFPTGVTVITTCDVDGTFKGFTSNAVTSVSLDPPMLLVCVALTSETLPVLRAARRFVVNFLKAGAHEVSAHFARKGPAKFDGVACSNLDGLPVLSEDTVAHALCATELEIEAGDHIVLIGRVVDGDCLEDVQPLLYYRSNYPRWLSP